MSQGLGAPIPVHAKIRVELESSASPRISYCGLKIPWLLEQHGSESHRSTENVVVSVQMHVVRESTSYQGESFRLVLGCPHCLPFLSF